MPKWIQGEMELRSFEIWNLRIYDDLHLIELTLIELCQIELFLTEFKLSWYVVHEKLGNWTNWRWFRLNCINFNWIMDKDAKNLYLTLEFARGGDMFTHLRKLNRFRFANMQISI